MKLHRNDRPARRSSMLFTLFACLALGISLGAASTADAGKCGFDSDCGGFGKCKSGECGACGFDSDCKGHGKCKSGRCGGCNFDSDCGGGKCSSGHCNNVP